MVYSYGWKVTEIDPGELVRDVHLVKPLVRDLLRPDLFTAERQSQIAEAVFFLSDFPGKTTGSDKTFGGRSLTLSESRGKIGDHLAVEGKGFKPGEKGLLVWINAIEQEYPLGSFETDERGNFQT